MVDNLKRGLSMPAARVPPDHLAMNDSCTRLLACLLVQLIRPSPRSRRHLCYGQRATPRSALPTTGLFAMSGCVQW